MRCAVVMGVASKGVVSAPIGDRDRFVGRSVASPAGGYFRLEGSAATGPSPTVCPSMHYYRINVVHSEQFLRNQGAYSRFIK